MRNPVVLAEVAPSGVLDYQYGLSLLSATSASFEHFYQTDGLGSTVTVTDGTAALKANYLYDPWGKMLNPIDPLRGSNPYKFAGQAQDAFGLSYNHQRTYDPQTGTFLSRDPFPGFAALPISTNPYIYAADNPVNRVDPSGFASEPTTSDGLSNAATNVISENGYNTPQPDTSILNDLLVQGDSAYYNTENSASHNAVPASLGNPPPPPGTVYGPVYDPQYAEALKDLNIAYTVTNALAKTVAAVTVPLLTAGGPAWIGTAQKIWDFGLDVYQGVSEEHKSWGEAVGDAATNAYLGYLGDQWTDPILDIGSPEE